MVFGASNFPLAFSTAGGDTASALAAGCPIIVKGHPGHPNTSLMVAEAIHKAAGRSLMPYGVFGHVEGAENSIGSYLVEHPLTKGVAFTGSYIGGKALFDLANKRAVPIPVFAEMGSVNPVFLFSKALELRGEAIAVQLADAVTLGVGQFCTNPGVVVGIESDGLDRFMFAFKDKIKQKAAAKMLHQGIATGYRRMKGSVLHEAGVVVVAEGLDGTEELEGRATLVKVSGTDFINNKILREEVFGPFAMVVSCKDDKELEGVISVLEGQLTATLMAEEADVKGEAALIAQIVEKCGRILMNGVPTGVEVTGAMQHGGPFPATTDARFTSVGESAIYRFVRPVCYQNFMDSLLPDALKDGNPLKIRRKVDGE